MQGSSVTWVDRRALSVGRRYVYVVTAEDTLGRSSGPSERLVVPYLAAPKAPRALSAAPGDRRISLTWQPPAELMDGSPAPGDLRYVVLRGAGAEGALSAITPRPVDGTSFTDEGVDNDTDYRYAVRAVRVDPAVSATGEPSAAVVAAAADTTPPAAPANLLAVPSPGAVRLAWNASGSAGRGALRGVSGGRDRATSSASRRRWRSPPSTWTATCGRARPTATRSPRSTARAAPTRARAPT